MAQTAGGTYYAASSELVSSWPATSLDLANQLESRFAAKADYAMPQNTQTGTGASAYTFVLADATRMTLANAATAATYTVPPQASVAWGANTIIQVTSIGAGVITFAGGSGVTVTNTAATLSQYQSAALIRTGSNAWTVLPFSGSGRATYSATTGSPTITSVSGKTCIVYNGAGTITIDKAGFLDCVMVGGGGSGGGNSTANYAAGGGGGGGGYCASTVYIEAGTYSVAIGAGGSGTTGAGNPGNPSAFYVYAASGGGRGGSYDSATGGNGASGGGGAGRAITETNTGGTPTSANQGATGGTGYSHPSNALAGGGGASYSGNGSNAALGVGGNGANGTASSITGSSVTRGGGGGGGGRNTAGTGGTGGGGGGGVGTGSSGANGTANTGGGGGGGVATAASFNGGNGGSGVVILLIG